MEYKNSVLLLLLLVLVRQCLAHKYYYMNSIKGEVISENFTYYTLKYKGPLKIILRTLEGDADLYISEKTLSPSYEADKYDLYSATCGIDTVTIPDSMQRPIGVGIYGHFSHKRSTYILEVYLIVSVDVRDLDYPFFLEEELMGKKSPRSGDRRSFMQRIRAITRGTAIKEVILTFLHKLDVFL